MVVCGGGVNFNKLTVIFFFAGMAGLWTSRHEISWDPGVSFDYMGYFLLGNVIRKNVNREKNNLKSILLIICGITVLFGVAWLQYMTYKSGISEADLEYKISSPYCPLPVIASVLIFIAFCKLNFYKDVTKLSGITFEIYLFHVAITEILVQFITVEMNSLIVIPLLIIVVFAFSTVAAVFYQRLWSCIDRKWEISARICKKLGLRTI